MRRSLPLLPLLLAGCHQAAPPADTPGARLEAAAVARGLVSDPRRGSLIGSWGSDTDRLCIVAAGRALRIGALVDYGVGQGCVAAGTAERKGDRLRVSFGACRFDARLDGERISFPAELPTSCSTLCSGRASLTALDVSRQSDSASEAVTLRAPDGRYLCGD